MVFHLTTNQKIIGCKLFMSRVCMVGQREDWQI